MGYFILNFQNIKINLKNKLKFLDYKNSSKREETEKI